MSGDAEGSPSGVLDKLTRVLDALSDGDTALGVSEIAARADLPKSTASRLVARLVREGYLERDGRRFRLGLRLFELGRLAIDPHRLRVLALPALVALRDVTEGDVHLVVPDSGDVVCVVALRGSSDGGGRLRTGDRLPARETAAGRCLLAADSSERSLARTGPASEHAAVVRRASGRPVAAVSARGAGPGEAARAAVHRAASAIGLRLDADARTSSRASVTP